MRIWNGILGITVVMSGVIGLLLRDIYIGIFEVIVALIFIGLVIDEGNEVDRHA